MTKHQTEASKEPSKDVSAAGIDDTMAQAANLNGPLGLKRRHFMGTVLALDAAALLAACGGGGGGGGEGGEGGGGSSAPTNYQWVVTTLGGTGISGFADGTGGTATFNSPIGVAVDTSGNVFVADQSNHRIRKINPAGVVSTLAGTGTSGTANGTGGTASFYSPSGVAVDTSGNLYVADYDNHLIRLISPAGLVSILAGAGSAGSVDGMGTAASFNNPNGVALDTSGNVYVADLSNHKIRKVTPAGVVSTLAGTGAAGSDNGTAGTATFNRPAGVAIDKSGNMFVSDFSNHKIRKITSAGVVSTVAGTGFLGNDNGSATTASFRNPFGVSVDSTGNVYVADYNNHMVRKISPEGVVSTFSGVFNLLYLTYTDGTAATAIFSNPTGVAVDKNDSVYVSDGPGHRIRKIALKNLA